MIRSVNYLVGEDDFAATGRKRAKLMADPASESIYLDYNATTPLAPEVIECMRKHLDDAWANPSSGYPQGQEARAVLESARVHLANLVGAASPEDIIFTSGGTESNNMVIFGVPRHFKEARAKQKTPSEGLPHIVTTNVEHDAVIMPIRHLHEEGLIEYTAVPVNKKGVVEVDEVLAAIRPNTVLITVMMANNESGVIMPISDIGQKLQRINRQRIASGLIKILYHTDAAQAIGKIPVDVEDLLVDYLTIVGHKFYGPRGGCLYVRGPQKTTPVYPMFFGGGHERGMRPGTENTLVAAGLGKAAFLAKNFFNQNQSIFICFREYLETKLKETFREAVVINFRHPGVPFLPNTCSVTFLTSEKFTGQEILSESGVAASVASACHSQDAPSGILISSGLSAEMARMTIRLSVGMLTSKADIEEAINRLKSAIDRLKSEKIKTALNLSVRK